MIEPGTSLLHYRVVEKLGEGGMGAVWKATDATLEREVAIKVLPAAFASDPERLARFERKAKVLASLNHPNIAAIYGFHDMDGTRFLAMELVPGEGLDQRISRGPMPVDDALQVASKIAEALDANHQPAFWTLAKDGRLAGPFLAGVRDLQFYRNGRTVLYVREAKEGSGLELRAADLESGADALLYKGWVTELAVAANGRRISFLLAESHLNLNLFTLDLVPGSRPGELPRVVGEPHAVTEGKGRWHVHNGSLSADGKLVAYTRDTDTADIFAITGALPH